MLPQMLLDPAITLKLDDHNASPEGALPVASVPFQHPAATPPRNSRGPI